MEAVNIHGNLNKNSVTSFKNTGSSTKVSYGQTDQLT